MTERAIEISAKQRFLASVVAVVGLVSIGGVLAIKEPGPLKEPFEFKFEDIATNQILSTPSNGDVAGAALVGVGGGYLVYARRRLPDDVNEEKVGAQNE